MSPGGLNDLPKVTQLIPDFVLIILLQSKSKCLLAPAHPLGAWGLVSAAALFSGAGLESGGGGGRGLFGSEGDSSVVTFIVF